MESIFNSLKDTILQMLRDYKSRKFLLAIGVIAIIVYNRIENIGITSDELKLIALVAGVYILIEGVADIVGRIMDKYFPKKEASEEGGIE